MSVRFLSGVNIDSNTLFVDDANNRVGIGTASPTQALDVTGRAYISSGASIGTTSTAGTGLTVNGSTVLLSFVEIQQGNLLYLYSSGNTYYSQIYQSGQNLILSPHSNVGIGTTSPSTKLEVVGGSVNTQIARFITADYPTHSVGLGVDAQSTYWGASIFQDDVKRFTVDSTGGILVGGNYQGSDAPANGAAIEGSVGIGTTSPSTKLDVIGTGVFGTMTTSRGSYSNGLSLQNNGGQATSLFLWQSGVASAHIGSPANSTSLHIVNSYNTGLITDPNAIVLDNTGNVGIGTTSPSSKLQSNTSSTYNSATPSGAIIASNLSGGNAIIDIGVDTSYLGYIQSRNILNTTAYNLLLNPIGGNVGIGTTSPNGALHVASSPQTRVVIENTGNDANGAGLIMTVRSSGTIVGNGGIYVDNSNNLILYNGGVYAGNERVRINNSGYVGINTTAPSSFLTVSPGGSGNAATFTSTANAINNYVGITLNAVTVSGVEWYGSEIRNINTNGSPGFLNPRLGFFTQNASTYLPADRTEKMSILGNGNVGIGTTAPGAKLHLSGAGATELRIASTTGNTNSLLSFYEVALASWGIDAGQANGSFFIKDLYNSATRLTILNSGNVGIGTTSPAYKLDVSGTARVTSTLLGGGRISAATEYRLNDNSYSRVAILDGAGAFAGGYNFNINSDFPQHDSTGAVSAYYYHSAGYISLFTNSSQAAGTAASERLRITSAGNVGIGTTSPSEKLDVYGAIKLSGQVASVVTNGIVHHTNGYVYFTGGTAGAAMGNDSYSSAIYAVDNGSLELYAGSANRLHITSGGNVGIGTTSPGAKLHVSGGEIRVDAGQAITLDTSNNMYLVGASNQLRLYNGANPVVNITTAGNVGIGTTSPGSLLHVYGATPTVKIQGTGTASAKIDLVGPYTVWTLENQYINGATNDMFRISNSELGADAITINRLNNNVGIGTTSPAYKLDVAGTISNNSEQNFIYATYDDVAALFQRVGTFGAVIKIGRKGVSNSTTIDYPADGTFAVSTAGLERLRITSAGNVGIGTTSPQVKLEVRGAQDNTIVPANAVAKFVGGDAGIFVGNLAGTPNYGAWLQAMRESDGLVFPLHLQPNGGNVGIGTTSPSQALHVSGSARVTGAYYDSNNSAGSSGQVLSSTGSGTDWVSLSEITGVDGTGTANYIAKWSDTDTITNSSITDNGSTVTANVDRLNMNRQAGIYTFSKTLGATVASDFFSISNSHGAQAFRVTFVCSSSGYSVAKTYEVVHAYGQTPIYFKVVDTGPYGSEDFDVAFTDSNSSTGVKATVTNNSATTAANIVATVFLGGGFETITVTAL